MPQLTEAQDEQIVHYKLRMLASFEQAMLADRQNQQTDAFWDELEHTLDELVDDAVEFGRSEAPDSYKDRYRELWNAHVSLIEAVEKTMQADYQLKLTPMSTAECQHAREDLQDILCSARREIGQP